MFNFPVKYNQPDVNCRNLKYLINNSILLQNINILCGKATNLHIRKV